MFLDGVLRKDKTAPIRQGLLVYKALIEKQRIIVVCEDKSDAERWFKENRLANKIDDIIPLDDVNDPMRTIDKIRSKGHINMVITSNLDLSVQLLEQGITALLFVEPKYIRPEFRPDARTGAKAWSDLTSELDRQQNLYETDKRLRDTE